MKFKPRMGFKRLGVIITLIALISTSLILDDRVTGGTTVQLVISFAIVILIGLLIVPPQWLKSEIVPNKADADRIKSMHARSKRVEWFFGWLFVVFQIFGCIFMVFTIIYSVIKFIFKE